MAEKDNQQPPPPQPSWESRKKKRSVINNREKYRPSHRPPSYHNLRFDDTDISHKMGYFMERETTIRGELKAGEWMSPESLTITMMAFDSYIRRIYQEIDSDLVKSGKTMNISVLEEKLTLDAFYQDLDETILQLEENVATQTANASTLSGKELENNINQRIRLENELNRNKIASEFVGMFFQPPEDYSI